MLNQTIGRELLGTRKDYNKEEAAMLSAAAGALEFLGPAARGVGRGVKSLGKNILGITTDLGVEGLERVYERPGVLGLVKQGAGEREAFRVGMGDQLQGLANSFKETASDSYGAAVGQVFQELGDPPININAVKEGLKKDLLENGINPGLTPEQVAQLSPQDQLKLKTPTVRSNQKELIAQYQLLQGLPDEVPASVAVRVRRGLDDLLYSENFINQSVAGVKSKAEVVLSNTRQRVGELYKGIDPRIAQADAAYSDSLNQYKMLKGAMKDERIEGTVNNLFGKNKEWQRLIIKNMQEKTGGPDILNSIMDLSLAEKSSKMLRPGGLGVIGGLSVVGTLTHNPVLLAAAPAFSPRVVTSIIGNMGKISRSETISLIKTMGLQPGFVSNYISKPAFRAFVLDSLRDFDGQKTPTPTSE
jgi:hypothetical protein